MLPPDFSNFSKLIYAMFETIEIAFLGTFIAIVLSIPLGLLSARNLAPNYFTYIICKTIVIFFRAIPEFIIAMILVIAIGFGAMPGVLALGCARRDGKRKEKKRNQNPERWQLSTAAERRMVAQCTVRPW